MRYLGVDVGRRRIGLAISDPSGMLARPLETLTMADGQDEAAAAGRVTEVVARLGAEDDGLAGVVVGLPVRLDGSSHEQTERVRRFLVVLRAGTGVPVHEADERLTSHEAESQLSVREKDWRKRKAKLDAAAAAIILQDFLDHV